MIFVATYISIAIGMGSLAWGFAEMGFDSFARRLLIFGAAWLFARWRRWWWFSAVGLILTVLVAAFGIWFGFSPGWMLSSGIFTLLAWDLTDFSLRTRFERPDEELREVQRRHLARNTLLAFAGLLLSSLLMWTRGQFSSAWGLLVTISILLGLLPFFKRRN